MNRCNLLQVFDLSDFEQETVIAAFAQAGNWSKRLIMIANPVKNRISYRVEVYYNTKDEICPFKRFEILEEAIASYNSYQVMKISKIIVDLVD